MFLLVLMCCIMANGLVLVSVCYDTAQALVFLLVSMWVSLGVLAGVRVL